MPRSIDVLLVEDSMQDIALLKHVLDSEKIMMVPFKVRNADEAIEFLMQRGIYSLMPTPDLVILDWKLPNFADGERVLECIRATPELKTLAVALISGYMQVDESRRALSLGASCCVEKPLTLAKVIYIVQQIPEFWLSIVRRPGPGRVCTV